MSMSLDEQTKDRDTSLLEVKPATPAAHDPYLKGVSDLTATSSPTPPDAWARDIQSVVTEKNIAAFERLFSHFAPKVKGFLIKSTVTLTSIFDKVKWIPQIVHHY